MWRSTRLSDKYISIVHIRHVHHTFHTLHIQWFEVIHCIDSDFLYRQDRWIDVSPPARTSAVKQHKSCITMYVISVSSIPWLGRLPLVPVGTTWTMPFEMWRESVGLPGAVCEKQRTAVTVAGGGTSTAGPWIGNQAIVAINNEKHRNRTYSEYAQYVEYEQYLICIICIIC